jgi:superfamily II DNA or RNA helicase
VRLTAGDCVTVRGRRWIVEEATSFGDTTLLELSAANVCDPAQRCRLLVPFDRPVLCNRSRKLRVMSRRRWGHHLRALLTAGRVHGQLRTPHAAAIDILPFQLEPSLAIIRGRASRVLLADEVGLGKTIQAGLVLAELRHRGWCDRALIITPSGLRGQWADELRHRFQVEAVVMDAARLSTLAASLPHHINPWTCDSVIITSIDFVKQPEVLHAVGEHVWDVLIVDEAHQAAAVSQRHDAVARVASRARHVVLVTATPHAGDERAFESLCALGQFEASDRIALFRRTRQQVGLARTRRVHLLRVRLTPAAMEMHRLLDMYVAKLWRVAEDAGKHDVRLVAMVLAKRAFSSAHSLRQSLERRAAGLRGDTHEANQPALPFDADTESADEAWLPATPAFDRVETERDVLQSLIRAARAAESAERKMLALRRILRRVRERVIVFTEYRDTLDAIAAATGDLRTIARLHGGMSPAERHESIAAFTQGNATLLLATDAGSEGLNLQPSCRLVVNLELPWNPIRLEQRVGRVDRLGQQRAVHAINLLAADTAEDAVLARLQQRVARIQTSEIELAACVINRSELSPRPPAAATHTIALDLGSAAVSEAERLTCLRNGALQGVENASGVVPVAVLARAYRRARATCPVYAIAFMRVSLATPGGRLIEDTIVPVTLPVADVRWCLKRTEVRAKAEQLFAALQKTLIRCAAEHAQRREKEIASELADWSRRAIARERHIGDDAAAGAAVLVQAGLFESRAVRRHLENRRRADAIREQTDSRTAALDAESHVRLPHDPELALFLITNIHPGASAGTRIE